MGYDVIVIGGGPAGLSAAVNVRARGRSVLVVSNPMEENPLWKAERVDNYLGLPGLSGAEMLQRFRAHAERSGAEMREGRVLNAMAMGTDWYVSIGSDVENAKAVVLAGGVARAKKFPGEAEYLGRGVSYCATCDGMLYRGKTVAVIGSGEEAAHDADFLESIGCTVLRMTKPFRYEIRGGLKADSVLADGKEYKVDGVFVIKDTVSVTKLVQGLAYSDGGIVTDKRMNTNIPGVFAAGDCTGKPYQLAKAAGEGNVAALSACEYIDKKKKEN